MAKEYAKAFYNSKEWQKCRRSYIAKRVATDGGLCEVCGERVGYMVHHIMTLTPDNINDPNITLNHEMLRLECKACHDREEGHFKEHTKQSKLNCFFDSEGNPKPLPTSPYKKIE